MMRKQKPEPTESVKKGRHTLFCYTGKEKLLSMLLWSTQARSLKEHSIHRCIYVHCYFQLRYSGEVLIGAFDSQLFSVVVDLPPAG